MKKFLYQLILFFFLSIFAYIGSIILWGEFAPDNFRKNLNYEKGTYGHLYTRLNDLDSIKNVDLLFLGSSHAYRGFDTRVFRKEGYTSFNLGSSAQSPLQTKVLLHRYLNKINPKLVVYEVYPGTFCSDGVESSIDIISNDKNDKESILMAFKQNHIKIYNALIYGFFSDIFKNTNNFIEPQRIKEDTYIQGGFVQRDIQYYKHTSSTKDHWDFEAKQFNAFNDNINFLKKNNIKFILIQAPVTKARYNSYINNSDFDNKMKIIGPYLNYNNLIQLNDSIDFYDPHHLNQLGVEKFNKSFLDRLSDYINTGKE